MTSFNYTQLKNYWKLKINALLVYKRVDVADLNEPNWEAKLDEDTIMCRQDINQFAIEICEDIYDKATVNVSDFPDDVNWYMPNDLVSDTPNTALNIYWNTFWGYIRDWEKITQFHFWLLDSLEYSVSFDDAKDDDAWKDLRALLNGNSLEKIVNSNNGFNDKISQIFCTTTVPTDWETKVVAKSVLDTANAEKAALQVKADNYDRIYAKLSGRVSDAELDNLLSSPPCSHGDYDAIKQERDTLKTELASQKLSIIERIINDCELGTDTEKTLDKLIVRINELIKDNNIISPAVKNEIIEASKELDLGDNFQQKLSEITTYSNLINIQKQAFNSKLSENKSEISKYQSRSNWAIGLGSLSFAGFLVLVYLLLRKEQREKESDIG